MPMKNLKKPRKWWKKEEKCSKKPKENKNTLRHFSKNSNSMNNKDWKNRLNIKKKNSRKDLKILMKPTES